LKGEYICPNHVNAIYPEVSVVQAEELIAIATTEASNDSIDRLVDQSFKSRRPEQQAYAKKFRELHNKYEENVERYRYGKKVSGLLGSQLQKIRKSNSDIFVPSEFIKNEQLVDFFAE
jgi:hypothetical protein